MKAPPVLEDTAEYAAAGSRGVPDDTSGHRPRPPRRRRGVQPHRHGRNRVRDDGHPQHGSLPGKGRSPVGGGLRPRQESPGRGQKGLSIQNTGIQTAPPMPISASCWPARTSTPSLSPSPTIGTPFWPFPAPAPAGISTARRPFSHSPPRRTGHVATPSNAITAASGRRLLAALGGEIPACLRARPNGRIGKNPESRGRPP